MASISIDGQADKINTRVKKNPESHIREEGLRIPNLGVPEGPESQVSYAGADSKSNYKAINFGENELNETSIESPGSGSTGKCECLSLVSLQAAGKEPSPPGWTRLLANTRNRLTRPPSLPLSRTIPAGQNPRALESPVPSRSPAFSPL